MAAIVPVTASPYAAARALEEPNPATSPMHATISPQLAAGT